jgi:hypothetical protein
VTLPAETQLEAFIDEYEPHIGAQARAALAKMRALVPGAVEMVYDNYNALVIGYGATERPSAFVCSLALYPRWVTLFFADGARLPDPTRRLTGSGKTVRSIRLAGAETLDEPDVRALLRTALERSETPFDPARPNRLVIRSVSAKRRPRRP